MSASRTDRIREVLEAAFAPDELLVKDQSHLHAGHAGAEDGRGHFEVVIVADAFAGKSRMDRHRLVYDTLGAMMESDIHALRIRARAPGEQ